MCRIRKPIVSVTASDCEWNFSRSSGAGGQNVNKRSTKVRCTHRASGAVGVAQDSRSQANNRMIAFRRMTETDTFQAWLKQEHARRCGKLVDIDAEIERMMTEANLRVEVKVDGKWTVVGTHAHAVIGDEMHEPEPGAQPRSHGDI